ncbi:FAD-dependent oxidoreductase [Halocynthiibacter namhaensis]|uniref:FAD-dependent oxidoreductase n=1 Tax=Halocynthiibacter namhaensis TaxID=1290553 RepID=UPI0006919455|nr:FAD-dependent monooxygenase [Halocynthiibacter namhaensis]
MKILHIGIVGAGVAGLCAAAGLARIGHRVQVFDQFDTPAPVGSGLMIQPVGQSVLDIMGCLGRAKDLGATINDMHGTVEKYPWPVLNVAYDPDGLTGETGLAMPRSALFQVLMDAALAAGAQLQPGHTVTNLNIDINIPEKRRLTFENGKESQSFDLVIDAAGARSPISPITAKPLKYGALWGSVDWVDAPEIPATRLTQRYLQAKHMAGVLPLGTPPGSDTPKAAVFWSMKRDDFQVWQDAPIEDWLNMVNHI